MGIPIVQIDAFTERPFAGNPAAVCLLPEEKPEAWMQSVAAEMNLAETAFLTWRGEEFGLRWFTPTVEMDLCGHATLAAASVLFHERGFRGDDVRFQSRSGLLPVARSGDLLTLDFAARPPVMTVPPFSPRNQRVFGWKQHPEILWRKRDTLRFW